MTIEEKRYILNKWCDEHSHCENCPLFDATSEDEPCFSEGANIERNYAIVFGDNESPTHDNVNHPSHYCRENAMECIDEMILIYGKEAVMHFCLCNAHKYRYRAADKNGAEDLKKSDWYLRKYKELKEDEM